MSSYSFQNLLYSFNTFVIPLLKQTKHNRYRLCIIFIASKIQLSPIYMHGGLFFFNQADNTSSFHTMNRTTDTNTFSNVTTTHLKISTNVTTTQLKISTVIPHTVFFLLTYLKHITFKHSLNTHASRNLTDL